MPIQPAMDTYTVRDYMQWEGDWELIFGQQVAMAPSPGLTHQTLSMTIARQLDELLDDCPRCQALFEIDVEFSEDTVVRPDLLVICYQPEGERLTRPHALIVEVIAPKTSRRDEVVKFDLYRTEGVMNYVLVYPDSKKAKVWRLVEGEYRKVGDFHDEQHRFDLAGCAVDFDFSRIWKRKGIAA